MSPPTTINDAGRGTSRTIVLELRGKKPRGLLGRERVGRGEVEQGQIERQSHRPARGVQSRGLSVQTVTIASCSETLTAFHCSCTTG